MKQEPDFDSKTDIDAFLPLSVISEICRKLPTSEEEMNSENLRNVGMQQMNKLRKYAKIFISEINHYIDLINLDKNEFYVWSESNEEEKKNEVFDMMQFLEERDEINAVSKEETPFDESMESNENEAANNNFKAYEKKSTGEDASDGENLDEIDYYLKNHEEYKTASPNNKSELSLSESKQNQTTSEKMPNRSSLDSSLGKRKQNVEENESKENEAKQALNSFFRVKKDHIEFC